MDATVGQGRGFMPEILEAVNEKFGIILKEFPYLILEENMGIGSMVTFRQNPYRYEFAIKGKSIFAVDVREGKVDCRFIDADWRKVITDALYSSDKYQEIAKSVHDVLEWNRVHDEIQIRIVGNAKADSVSIGNTVPSRQLLHPPEEVLTEHIKGTAKNKLLAKRNAKQAELEEIKKEIKELS